MKRDVTVAIPTIPPRRDLLWRALDSVWEQTHRVDGVSVAVDLFHIGAWDTRNRALAGVRTTWVAFLDDDDEHKPQHIERLLACAEDTDADYVYGWYDLTYIRGPDPLPYFGKPFDNAEPHITGSMSGVMVRTELAQAVRFTPPDEEWPIVGGEDERFTMDCVAQNAKIVHLPEVTYNWHWDRGGGTQGLPRRWI
jgi:glycosyltransferase involved in cell wall biosynthesis